MTQRESEVVTALQELVARFGTSVGDAPGSLDAKLRDLSANGSGREIAALVAAAREGIPGRLLAARGTPADITCAAVAQSWVAGSSVDPLLATWAVAVWARALDLYPPETPLPRSPVGETETEPRRTEPAPKRKGDQDQHNEVPPRPPVPKPRRPGMVAVAAVIAVVAVAGWYLWHRQEQAAALVAVRDADTAFSAKRYDAALAGYTRATRLDARLPAAWYGLGRTLNALHRYDDALPPLQRAIVLAPDAEGPYFEKGYALGELDRPAEAVPPYEEAVRLDPQDYGAWSNLAYNQYRLSKYEDALTSAERATALKSDFSYAWLTECKAAYRLNLAAAYQACEVAVRYGRNDAVVWEARGWSILNARRQPEYGVAEQAFRNSINLDKNHRAAQLGLGVSELRLGDYADALATIDTAINLFPKSAAAWNDRGVALWYLHRIPEAYCSYKRALALAPRYQLPAENLRKLQAAEPYIQFLNVSC